MTETAATPTAQLAAAGVSIWLDDLSRIRITSGDLARLINEKNVTGVTTNPTIFAGAIGKGEGYAEAITTLAARGTDPTEAIFELTTTDVADACDIFAPVYEATNGIDGRVSIEVEPGLAHDAEATIAQAKQLAARVGKPNVLIKIPATVEGLEAVASVIAEGISVNVTLIFSLARYREVINAYLSGIERARAAGIDISSIHSVASFFVSRVDTEIDKRLDAIGTPEAAALKGKAGVANAQLAYQIFEEEFTTERAKNLIAAGARLQRPLWASTGVKDPNLPDTLYVTGLVAHEVVNTMPEKTLNATYEHGIVSGDTITAHYKEAGETLDAIEQLGIHYDEVTELLEKEGVEKFIASWNDLLASVQTALTGAKGAAQ